MRKYVVGDGWRFELIDRELSFFSNKVQWNYKLEDLLITNTREYTYAINIRYKSTGKLILRLSMYNSLTSYWDFREYPYCKVSVEEYSKITTFFKKII